MGSGGGGKGKEISWGGLGFCNGGWLLVLEKEKGGGDLGYSDWRVLDERCELGMYRNLKRNFALFPRKKRKKKKSTMTEIGIGIFFPQFISSYNLVLSALNSTIFFPSQPRGIWRCLI